MAKILLFLCFILLIPCFDCEKIPRRLMECNADSEVNSGDDFRMNCALINVQPPEETLVCIWLHGDDNQCAIGPEENGIKCQNDERWTAFITKESCRLEVSNSQESDNGNWHLTILSLNSNGDAIEESVKEFEINIKAKKL